MANYNWNTGAQGAGYTNGGSSAGVIAQSISSLNLGAASLTLDDVLGTAMTHVKKYQVLEIEEDLLALSTAWYRLRQGFSQGQPYVGISKLVDKELFNLVTEDDKMLAASIRDYYSKKVMMWKLKGQALTKFREDMNSFIHSNGRVFREDMCPLVYRLPEFYHYDLGFDSLTSAHNKFVKASTDGVCSKELTLQKTFTVGKRYSKRKEYWFTDENDNLVTFSLTHDNPLLSLLELHSQKPLRVSGKYTIRERDNVQYMIADKYTFS